MNEIILLQSPGIAEWLLECQNAFQTWVNYIVKAVNVVLIIWLIVVFFVWRMGLANRQILFAVFWGLLQDFWVFSVENNLLTCYEASTALWIMSVINVLAFLSPIIYGGRPQFLDLFTSAFNVIKEAYVFLLFSCITFVLLNIKVSWSSFSLEDFFTLDNFLKALLPVYVCYQ